jgi:hypothetical protein
MPETWKPIFLSAKVFGHLSRGLYRTPAGAIKELISNSFDADATLVRIHTGFPRFETFSCEDDGTGMSVSEFERLMNRGIGSSYKRSSPEAAASRFFSEVLRRGDKALLVGFAQLIAVWQDFTVRDDPRSDRVPAPRRNAALRFRQPCRQRQADEAARQEDDGSDHRRRGQRQPRQSGDSHQCRPAIRRRYLRYPLRG